MLIATWHGAPPGAWVYAGIVYTRPERFCVVPGMIRVSLKPACTDAIFFTRRTRASGTAHCATVAWTCPGPVLQRLSTAGGSCIVPDAATEAVSVALFSSAVPLDALHRGTRHLKGIKSHYAPFLKRLAQRGFRFGLQARQASPGFCPLLSSVHRQAGPEDPA